MGIAWRLTTPAPVMHPSAIEGITFYVVSFIYFILFDGLGRVELKFSNVIPVVNPHRAFMSRRHSGSSETNALVEVGP